MWKFNKITLKNSRMSNVLSPQNARGYATMNVLCTRWRYITVDLAIVRFVVMIKNIRRFYTRSFQKQYYNHRSNFALEIYRQN